MTTIIEETKTNGVPTPQSPQNPQDVQNAVMMFMMEELRALRTEMSAMRTNLQAQPVAKTATKLPANRQIDLITGKVYASKAAAGKDVAKDYGFSVENPPRNKKGESAWNFIFYYLPDAKERFRDYTGTKNAGEIDYDHPEVIAKPEEPKAEAPKPAQNQPTQPQNLPQNQQKPAQNQPQNQHKHGK